jgi:hypothetical protein
MDDRYLFALVMLRDEITSDSTLLIVAAADAEDVAFPLFSQLRVGRTGRDLNHLLLGIDIRGRNRRAGAEMPGNQLHSFARHLIGNRHGLLGIASVVADFADQLLTQNAAGSVEIGHRLLETGPHLGTKCGIRARHRTDGCDHGVGMAVLRARDHNAGSCQHD